MMFSDMTPVLPLTKSGQLRALATITPNRSALFSELPIMGARRPRSKGMAG
jgi:tripartite-type tricarboxylate transporter receptor subunit TctC